MSEIGARQRLDRIPNVYLAKNIKKVFLKLDSNVIVAFKYISLFSKYSFSIIVSNVYTFFEFIFEVKIRNFNHMSVYLD